MTNLANKTYCCLLLRHFNGSYNKLAQKLRAKKIIKCNQRAKKTIKLLITTNKLHAAFRGQGWFSFSLAQNSPCAPRTQFKRGMEARSV